MYRRTLDYFLRAEIDVKAMSRERKKEKPRSEVHKSLPSVSGLPFCPKVWQRNRVFFFLRRNVLKLFSQWTVWCISKTILKSIESSRFIHPEEEILSSFCPISQLVSSCKSLPFMFFHWNAHPMLASFLKNFQCFELAFS